ncbi:hypothetical protein B0H63DRAFT_461922 [Podospora didyma]|uniref:DNA polymerase epsilon subunit D n=1 Tax=Podospora didyma TaxID=330526 RepID=A0AAE0U8K1_9PEZI|nr:hypothetical protein B0H63DRAFT_461922 [Podospora didyma]
MQASRKSDARRSDVSAAHFVLAEEDRGATPGQATDSPAGAEVETTATEQPDAATTTTTTEPEPERSVSFSSPSATRGTSLERKDTEKEKERERERDAITIEDLTLPKSIITRLAKGVLLPNTQIQANAILALNKSAAVFISHLANAANESTLSSNKKTIMPADVFKALDDIEFGFMRPKLEAEFAKFNEVQTSKRSSYRKKVADAKKAATQPGSGAIDSSMLGMDSPADDTDRNATAAGGDEEEDHQVNGGPRQSKKARLDTSIDSSRMEVDEEQDASDADSLADEHEDDEEEDDDDDDEQDDEVEEEEDENDEDGPEAADDEAEDRKAPDEDEALDNEDSE